ncbi:MAG: ribonuclease D [Rhodobacterales bacterium]|nr:MAG: ribonuclease D [Rhodobacterales bacterium]
MKTITTTDQLAAFCQMAATHDYVTVDTEFLRERTYYSKLCLIQLAVKGDGDDCAVLVDPLVEGLSLAPLYDLFRNQNVVKVFHAARQDLEIFYIEGGVFPKPLFDTQVAAMVCGFGEQVGYETLVRKIAKQSMDKSSRFTDWSRRPLTDAQKNYAIGDVTHLRVIYEFLSKKIEKSNRHKWVEEELKVLLSPETYVIKPGDAWKRVKTRSKSGRFMAIVKQLAAFREQHAQSKNVPRNRVYKDEAMLELASTKPANMQELGRSRLLQRDARRGAIAEGILKAVAAGQTADLGEFTQAKQAERPQINPALADLLRVLLKSKAEQSGVAVKLIATSAELDAIAAGQRDGKALHGWRKEVFGKDALRLCNGEIGLTAKGSTVKVVEL